MYRLSEKDSTTVSSNPRARPPIPWLVVGFLRDLKSIPSFLLSAGMSTVPSAPVSTRNDTSPLRLQPWERDAGLDVGRARRVPKSAFQHRITGSAFAHSYQYSELSLHSGEDHAF